MCACASTCLGEHVHAYGRAHVCCMRACPRMCGCACVLITCLCVHTCMSACVRAHTHVCIRVRVPTDTRSLDRSPLWAGQVPPVSAPSAQHRPGLQSGTEWRRGGRPGPPLPASRRPACGELAFPELHVGQHVPKPLTSRGLVSISLGLGPCCLPRARRPQPAGRWRPCRPPPAQRQAQGQQVCVWVER